MQLFNLFDFQQFKLFAKTLLKSLVVIQALIWFHKGPMISSAQSTGAKQLINSVSRAKLTLIVKNTVGQSRQNDPKWPEDNGYHFQARNMERLFTVNKSFVSPKSESGSWPWKLKKSHSCQCHFPIFWSWENTI